MLSRDPRSLGEVAAAASVGRTTLHRYFPERSDLLAAIAVHPLEQVAAATERAGLETAPRRTRSGGCAASTSSSATC